MLMLRLSRTGRNNVPTFTILATEKRNPSNDGNFIEKLGTYLPAANPPKLSIKKDRVEYYLSRGAMVSETLARLLHKEGVQNMDRFVDLKKRFQKKKKSKGEAATPAAGPTPSAS